jgi:hypothetical protein
MDGWCAKGTEGIFEEQTNRIRCEIAHSQFGHSLGTGPGVFCTQTLGSTKELGTFGTECINTFSNCVRLDDLIFA